MSSFDLFHSYIWPMLAVLVLFWTIADELVDTNQKALWRSKAAKLRSAFSVMSLSVFAFALLLIYTPLTSYLGSTFEFLTDRHINYNNSVVIGELVPLLLKCVYIVLVIVVVTIIGVRFTNKGEWLYRRYINYTHVTDIATCNLYQRMGVGR